MSYWKRLIYTSRERLLYRGGIYKTIDLKLPNFYRLYAKISITPDNYEAAISLMLTGKAKQYYNTMNNKEDVYYVDDEDDEGNVKKNTNTMFFTTTTFYGKRSIDGPATLSNLRDRATYHAVTLKDPHS
ncbi:hypothetical protein LX36DRAFT_675508 [Colletotrichum falcatum]|nr:hypothetical protein LX36DRAFT_675508 [Colletotrichum falcatum]